MRPNSKLMMTVLRNEFFQRLPGLWIVGFLLPLSIWGPFVCPVVFSAYFLFLHLIFLGNVFRTAYGMYTSYFLTVKSSKMDWSHSFFSSKDTNSAFIHVILIPNYKELLETLSETLDVLASHKGARSQYRVCLAMEGSEPGSQEKARYLVATYKSRFMDLCFSIHPAGRPGEIRGKSSNVSWAAKEMLMRCHGTETAGQIITVMDADSHFAQDYFDAVAYHYNKASPSDKSLMMFVPPTVFDRNADRVPAVVRITDIFWSVGVLSNLYPSSSIKIPCSAYSLSLDLCRAVHFWDVGPEAIGEDLHMYLKVAFATNGLVKMIPIYSPVSQCNIQSPFLGLKGWVYDIVLRYSQAKRHLWGSLDTGYSLNKMCCILASVLRFKIIKAEKLDKPNLPNILLMLKLLHRVLEAHIFMGHLFFLLATLSVTIPNREHWLLDLLYSTLASTSLPHVVLVSMSVGFYLRILALVPTLVTIYYYELYHRWVSHDRWILQDVSRPGRRTDSAIEMNGFAGFSRKSSVHYLGKRGHLVSSRSLIQCLLDCTAIPLSGLLFYVLPQFHAQLSHLVTMSLEYEVSTKPHSGDVVHRHGESLDKLGILVD